MAQISSNQPGTNMFEAHIEGQINEFERAMDKKNFEVDQELTKPVADPKLFTGIWPKKVHVQKQQYLVYGYLAPCDIVDPETNEFLALVRQKSDWIYFISFGCFKNQELANRKAKELSVQYPFFDYHVVQNYAFFDVPSRIEPGSVCAENPTGKIVSNNTRLQSFMEEYFRSQEKSRDAHLSRIGRDMQKATEEQEKKRIINKREQERLAKGGNPNDLTLDAIQRQMMEFDENGGIESYEDESHFSNKFETPKEAMHHRGYRFGPDLINVAKPNDNSPLVAAAQANALAVAAASGMSRQELVFTTGPSSSSSLSGVITVPQPPIPLIEREPSPPIGPPAPNIEPGTLDPTVGSGSLISRIDITDTLPPPLNINEPRRPTYQYEFNVIQGEDLSMEEFDQMYGENGYATITGARGNSTATIPQLDENNQQR